jgi:thioredoxin 1
MESIAALPELHCQIDDAAALPVSPGNIVPEKAKPMLHTSPYLTVTSHTFRQEVLESTMLVLVDCWASWCNTSLRVNPVLEELAIEWAGQVKFSRLDLAKAQQIESQYDIRAVPTLLLFKNGRMLERMVGIPSHDILNHQFTGRLTSQSVGQLTDQPNHSNSARSLTTAS